MRKALLVLSLLAFGAAGSTACATKGFVRNQVNQVSGKVDSLSQSLEQTQERTRQNEARIAEVDTKADNAATSATRAQESATAADGKATQAGETARMAGEKVEAVSTAMNRVVMTVVLSEDKGGFKFNAIDLPEDAKASIDQAIRQQLDNPKGAFFEIEGHTDSTGPESINERIGMERAETVKRYLYETHQIPLHRINTISYGESKPVGDNKTRDGRAQNRRIVIRILN
jgi:outer membrane protein OmpA-like peptidoglycan-associated protein